MRDRIDLVRALSAHRRALAALGEARREVAAGGCPESLAQHLDDTWAALREADALVRSALDLAEVTKLAD